MYGLTCDGVQCSKKETIFTSIAVFIVFVIMLMSLYAPYFFYKKTEQPKLNYNLTGYATEHFLDELNLYNVTAISFKNTILAPRVEYKTTGVDYQLKWDDSTIDSFYGYIGDNDVVIVTTHNTKESIDYVSRRVGIAIDAVIEDIKERQRKDIIKREWEQSERVEAN